ncbi:MAG: mandelate racemase/muconate lactonizing enzyme family protein [Candidatus Hydrogenedentes bacterium]|jgi:L-alanine-DL-glutamate epimerase-like enolase superfamily enzyme|nr:mandelate racemase/muconate lactonizing enzyme family protein [Candidatus Hydrogenedentota bacterium]
MGNPHDVRPVKAALYFLPVKTRMPLKFGPETLTEVVCARVCFSVETKAGQSAEGWGETPLSVQWVWPSALSYSERYQAIHDFCLRLVKAWSDFPVSGHPMEIGHAFVGEQLPKLLQEFNVGRRGKEMPWLAALVCCSAFDIALHDAYGMLHKIPVYESYSEAWMNADLSAYLEADPDCSTSFKGLYPSDFFVKPRENPLPAWHLVGGLDPLEDADCDGSEPQDGYPVTLIQWIEKDGLFCLKIKLRGTDAPWDYERLVRVGRLALQKDVTLLSADFNCTVTDPAYVNDILDRLKEEEPEIFKRIRYVEQPFPYDIDAYPIDVHSVAARKPLFMDESAHDWHVVRRGRELGWTGVALKTCKTQTGALLSLCWAKAHGMELMIQDLTNPMLAQIPHVLLAAHAGSIMGVETNAMQFYPEASLPEAVVHPGIYTRRRGHLDLSSIRGPGFGYDLEKIKRSLVASE